MLITEKDIKGLIEEDVKDVSSEALTELKTKIASFIKAKKEGDKERKALEKANKSQWAKDNLKVGDVVVFKYKEEELEGEVSKLNDKSFTVAFEYEGEDKSLSRLYHLFVNKVEEEEEVA